MLEFIFDKFTCKNTKSEDKPNEDLIAVDFNNKVGLVLDGVSRDKENGAYPNPSPAVDVSTLFSESVLNSAEGQHGINLSLLQKYIIEANYKIGDYNKNRNLSFPAGTVGIVFAINRNEFNYAYVGDCYGMIIRNSLFNIFTECQTKNVHLYKKSLNTKQIRFEICNHINHPFGYGVLDGNIRAADFLKMGTILLEEGDTVLLFTDGLYDEVINADLVLLSNAPLADLFTLHPEQGADDRTCLRITVAQDQTSK